MPKPKKWKRGGPKATRAGCPQCKWWKWQGNKRVAQSMQEQRARLGDKEVKDAA